MNARDDLDRSRSAGVEVTELFSKAARASGSAPAMGRRTTGPTPIATCAMTWTLPLPVVRRTNLRMFDTLCDRMYTAHNELPAFSEIRSRAQVAIGRLPLPILGSGLALHLAITSDGSNAFRNFLRILVDVETRLRVRECINTADAFVRALAEFRSEPEIEIRNRLIETGYRYEVLSTELVLLLLALRYH